MPLPTPKKDETKEDFILRCMSDEKMEFAFPAKDQRSSVAINLYDKAGDMERIVFSAAAGDMPPSRLVAQFRQSTDSPKMYTWDVEVFAEGKWNGYPFSKDDLDKIVESFSALHDAGYLDAPLKFGHNNEQQMTDGYPALGWIDKLYTKKDDKGRYKLWASFVDVPEVVYEAAKRKLYRKVSIELDFDVEHKGEKYSYVLTGIALLGADLPAVNTLADLNAYMGRSSMVASRRMSFTAVNGNLTKEKPKMAEIDDDELATLRAQAAKAEAAENKVEEFQRNEAKAKVKSARDAVNSALDAAVEDMRITPAQRAGFSKTLRVDDDEAVVSLTVEDVNVMLPEKKKDDGSGEHTFGRNKQEEMNDGDSTDDILDTAARKIIAESGGKMNYSRALEKAMQANPEVAREHLGLDKEEQS